MPNCDGFQYLGATIDQNKSFELKAPAGGCSKWRQASGLLICYTLVEYHFNKRGKPAISYGDKCWAMNKRAKEKVYFVDVHMSKGYMELHERMKLGKGI